MSNESKCNLALAVALGLLVLSLCVVACNRKSSVQPGCSSCQGTKVIVAPGAKQLSNDPNCGACMNLVRSVYQKRVKNGQDANNPDGEDAAAIQNHPACQACMQKKVQGSARMSEPSQDGDFQPYNDEDDYTDYIGGLSPSDPSGSMTSATPKLRQTALAASYQKLSTPLPPKASDKNYFGGVQGLWYDNTMAPADMVKQDFHDVTTGYDGFSLKQAPRNYAGDRVTVDGQKYLQMALIRPKADDKIVDAAYGNTQKAKYSQANLLMGVV